jgi:hypothetical protein
VGASNLQRAASASHYPTYYLTPTTYLREGAEVIPPCLAGRESQKAKLKTLATAAARACLVGPEPFGTPRN